MLMLCFARGLFKAVVLVLLILPQLPSNVPFIHSVIVLDIDMFGSFDTYDIVGICQAGLMYLV